MVANTTISNATSSAALPLPYRAERPYDVLLGLLGMHLAILALVTPCTPSWKLVRSAVIAPLSILCFAFWGYVSHKSDHGQQWEISAGCTYSIVKTLDLLVFYPAEEHVYRLRPKPRPQSQPQRSGTGEGEGKTLELVPEPIPPAWTWAKLYWAYSLYWSTRGIGWNYSCPLPTSSTQAPFSRTSTRRHFLLDRLRYFIALLIAHDCIRSFMNLGPGRGFFDGRPGSHPGYDTLVTWERAVYSLCVAFRIIWSMEKSYVVVSLLCVGLGGLFGWTGEMWEPWGFPPYFGKVKDIWRHPGLSYMWSKTWHQYYRRWLYLFGWLGIGETILRLPHTGTSSRPLPPKSATKSLTNGKSPAQPTESPSPLGSAAITPSVSGRASPTHPLPAEVEPAAPAPVKRMSSRLMISNLLKSLIVFTLTGWIHDQASYWLLVKLHVQQDRPLRWQDAMTTTPFFVVQPFALAVEAHIKTHWRRFKDAQYPGWRAGSIPGHAVFMERLLGFIATWWWLGWTARWFVVGLCQVGMFRRDETQELSPSIVGGLVWGKWYH